MAYISTENVAMIRAALKEKFPKFKFSVRKCPSSLAVYVNIMEGDVDFFNPESGMAPRYGDEKYTDINQYHLYQYNEFASLFEKIIIVIKNSSNKKYYDNSDSQIDYFDTAFYINLGVGKFDKSYIYKAGK